jgi:hypothetical protein
VSLPGCATAGSVFDFRLIKNQLFKGEASRGIDRPAEKRQRGEVSGSMERLREPPCQIGRKGARTHVATATCVNQRRPSARAETASKESPSYSSLSGIGSALGNSIFGNGGNNTLDGGGAADVLTGNAGNDTFMFNMGEGDGDTVVDFAGNGAAAGDALQFAGYGAGASFTNIDATHWQVNYNGGTSHDVITFMNGAAIDASDFMFV